MSGLRTLSPTRPGWRVWVAGALAVLVVVVVLVARLTGGGEEPAAQRGAVPEVSGSPEPGPPGDAPGGASTKPVPTSTAGDDGATGPGPYGSRAKGEAVTAAVAFVRAWATRPPAGQPGQWLDGVSRHADPALIDLLRGVDPGTVPSTRVTGAPQSVSGGPTHAQVRVPTDGGPVLVLCVLVKDRWLVADFDPEGAPS
jgi:hypothetical protein